MAKVSTTPAGYHTVTPYLTVKGAARAIEFYKKAFGAVEVMRLDAGPDAIVHAEVKIGDSHVMLADESPDAHTVSPTTMGGATNSLMVYTPDCDALYKQAIAAGAKSLREPKDQFYGDRSCQVQDPFGHFWSLATHIEDVSVEEVKQRMAAMFGS